MITRWHTNVDLDKVYTKREFDLGARAIDEQGREYVFVKYESDPTADGTAVVGVAGYLAMGLTSGFNSFVVTCDEADVAVVHNWPIGFLQAALTDGTYGWAQYRGKNRVAMLTGGGVAVDEVLIGCAHS